MDYGEHADISRHANSDAFFAKQLASGSRIVLLTSKGSQMLHTARFEANDTILLGSESAGVPDEIHELVDLRIRIPMGEGFRSLNIAVAAGIALHEAMRQTGTLPE